MKVMLRIYRLVLALLLFSVTAVAGERHISATFMDADGSGVGGKVELTSMPGGGTLIVIQAIGLEPGTRYISFYHGNDACELEPRSYDDLIGEFFADAAGNARVVRMVEDDLEEISSISVGLSYPLDLLACADMYTYR